MTNDELLNEIVSLPAGAKRQIEKFIASLKKCQKTQADSRPATPLRDEEFVGMWVDRKPPQAPAR